VSLQAPGGVAISGTTFTVSLDTLAAGASATVPIVVSPTTGGTLASALNLTSDDLDANPLNDSANIRTTVTGGAPIITRPRGRRLGPE
jgi:hypothetical protein